MSQRHPPILNKLEDEPLWNTANELTEYFYSILASFPEEEKWNTETKIKQEANNLLTYTGEALGSSSPGSAEYEWNNVRKALSGLKTMYRFAGRQKFVPLEPEIMVKLTAMLTAIDAKVREAFEATEAQNKYELDIWREKYAIWKATLDQTEAAKGSL